MNERPDRRGSEARKPPEPLRGLQPLQCSVPKLDAPTISAPESDFSDVPALEDMNAGLFSFEIPDGAPEVDFPELDVSAFQ